MENVIVDPNQISPSWLTGVLRAHGSLPCGHVTLVTPDELQTSFASQVCRLAVNYSKDTPRGVPNRLFLKITNPALVPGRFDPGQLANEYTFYQRAAPAMRESFTIPCYHTVFIPDTGAGHLLLKDVSETHSGAANRTGQACREQAIDILARLHAFWWDHPRLGIDIGSFPSPEERQRDCVEAQASTTAFISALGERLDPAYRAVYERVLPALPGLFRRHAQGRNLTLAHGDAHLGNFLFPHEPEGQPVYILDWQFWHPTIGGTDLAFLLATETDTAARRNEELPLLRRYYHRLLERGVRDYTWEACWDDYRLSVILMSLFIPVWRWSLFHWEPDFTALERGMAAYFDLTCDEIIKNTSINSNTFTKI